MSTPFSIAVSYLDADYENALLQTSSAMTRRNQASDAWFSGNDHSAIGHLVGAMAGVIQAVNYVVNGTLFSGGAPFLPAVLQLCWEYDTEDMPGDDLTMDKILDTIWESDKLRWFHFINYIDSMRAGIWNIEIYEKHLEEWYRHFSE